MHAVHVCTHHMYLPSITIKLSIRLTSQKRKKKKQKKKFEQTKQKLKWAKMLTVASKQRFFGSNENVKCMRCVQSNLTV